MAKRRRSFFKSSKVMWPLIALLTVIDGAGIYALLSSYRAEAAYAEQQRVERLRIVAIEAAKPKPPPPPAMIHPPAVASVLQSGTLIVISKKSQHMYVFSDGMLWDSSPVSTGKRRHETPSGVFPILQKRKFHRSNIYSGAPMPFMQRLSWEGIALHAGYVPGYPASHGCIRLPRGVAASLFKLTNMTKTTVVVGDDPLESELHAQQFALNNSLPIRSALAPIIEPPPVVPPFGTSHFFQLAAATVAQSRVALAIAAQPVLPPEPTEPANAATPIVGGQTIQLAAAETQAEAEAYWARLQSTRPDISRFAKRVEAADVNARRVYRLRISGTDAHGYCAKLKAEGIGCLNVS